VCLAPLSKSERNPYQRFIFVGRASTCDVILRDASVSKTHAVFERDERQALWKLRDNRSHNGTWHNGERLEDGERVSLESGDVIVLGSYPVYFMRSPDLMKILARPSLRPPRL
jgi:pSer/pThr/pTyr-binding forkhead associated (FHA) protein